MPLTAQQYRDKAEYCLGKGVQNADLGVLSAPEKIVAWGQLASVYGFLFAEQSRQDEIASMFEVQP